jgi:DNA polymerase (family 10)
MAEEAIKRGYEYIAITEHSKATGVANGLDEKRLLKHIERIDKFNEELKRQKIPFTVLKGSEVDIRADGSLDYPAEILGKLDIRIGAIHSGFTQSKEKMTARVISAIKSGFIDILAHPTGRIINIRAPYEIDMEAVMRAAKENNTAMELNSYPERLDLKDNHLRLAREMGVPIAINTDAHSFAQLANIEYGLHFARRAWLEPKNVLNCNGIVDLQKILKSKH